MLRGDQQWASGVCLTEGKEFGVLGMGESSGLSVHRGSGKIQHLSLLRVLRKDSKHLSEKKHFGLPLGTGAGDHLRSLSNINLCHSLFWILMVIFHLFHFDLGCFAGLRSAVVSGLHFWYIPIPTFYFKIFTHHIDATYLVLDWSYQKCNLYFHEHSSSVSGKMYLSRNMQTVSFFWSLDYCSKNPLGT